MEDSNNTKTFDGKLTIDTALQLIRYDIPVLILGKSSIGKSYTLIDITKKWHIPHSLLYVGSEKSENIEGVPKLTERKEGKEILEYLKPYWFPNSEVITYSVKRGRVLFEQFIDGHWDNGEFDYGYNDLNSILNALSYINFEKEFKRDENGNKFKYVTLVDKGESVDETVLNSKSPFLLKVYNSDSEQDNDDAPKEYVRNDLADFCLYLTTCLGYGNFWLILDEIDKVTKQEQDKYAPLLHIVRERILKNFRLVDINDGQGLDIPKSINKGGLNKYKGIAEKVNSQLDSGELVLDTRVMAVANRTDKIEEALFRRFVQLVAEEVMIWRESSITPEQRNIEDCLIATKRKMVIDGLGSYANNVIEPSKIKKIDEINLQWQYNFIPKMMNDRDIYNLFTQSILEVYSSVSQGDPRAWGLDKKFTPLYKIFQDNFKLLEGDSGYFDMAEKLFDCLVAQLIKMEKNDSNKVSEEEIKEGEREEISNKIEELGGDLSLVADSIGQDIVDLYPQYVKDNDDDNTRLQGLTDWTNVVVDYLNAVVYDSKGQVIPIELSKYLIPKLVGVFYSTIGVDDNNQSDNVASVSMTFSNFFKKLYEDKSNINIKCDKDATERVFFGGTKSELKSLNEDDLDVVSKYSIFGATDSRINISAIGSISAINGKSTLPLFIENIRYKFITDKDSANAIISSLRSGEYSELRVYLRDNFNSELNQLHNEYKIMKDNASNEDDKREYNQKEIITRMLLK